MCGLTEHALAAVAPLRRLTASLYLLLCRGIAIDGGHETMISETWVAAYFWSDPNKERNSAVGIGIFGNDHYVSNTIVFSSRVGVQLTGAANILNGVHTWNDAKGNGGIGILNSMSQNRFIGCYLDFNDLVLAGDGAQQTSISDGFFLGGGQIQFQARAAGNSVFGVAIVGNVWFDTNSPALAVNESSGTWTSVTDLTVVGTTLQQGQATTHVPRATIITAAMTGSSSATTVDFSRVLLFPHAPIQSASVTVVGPADGSGAAPPTAIVGALPNSAAPLVVSVYAPAPAAYKAPFQLVVTADQSAYSTTSRA